MAASDLSLSGLASGFDWKSFIDQMIQIERAPEQRLLANQTKINQKNSVYDTIKTQLSALQSRVKELNDPSLYDSRTAQTSDAAGATAIAAKGAALGTFTFTATQLATAARINGIANAGRPLSATNDVSTLTLSSAAFPVAVSAGTFTVNGKQVTIATADTLQQVFGKIAAATGNQVTAAYDSGTDKITLTSAGEIVLGSATDSSNFLQAARLVNNGTGSITSSQALGGVRLTGALSAANLTTTVSDGGSGAGQFKINGVAINFNANTDSVADVIGRINSSTAGVTATYDVLNDRFTLTSKATGDMGIALEDVTGNFLAATGLSSGTLTHGKNLLYTVNGGSPLVSQSNTITEDTSGIAGLSATMLKENSPVTITVTSDTAKIKTAIQNLVDAYNKVQSLIDSQTASSTDAKGVVTAGVLADESGADEITTSLRRLVYSPISGLTGGIDHLDDLGIASNGNNNSLALADTAKLDTALATNLTGIKQFFSDATNGLGSKIDSYLTNTIGDSGTLVTHQGNLTRQSKDIDQQITDMERLIQADKDRMTAQFVAMETAQQQINQQLQFLSQQLSQSSK